MYLRGFLYVCEEDKMDFRDCKIDIEVRVANPNDGVRDPFGLAIIWTFTAKSDPIPVSAPASVYTRGQVESIIEQLRKGLDAL
jgi:hypothetical protein